MVKFGEPQIYIQRGHSYRRRVHPVIFKKEVIVISVQVSPVAASSLMRLVSYNFSVDRFIYLDNISAISKEKIRIEQRIVESRIVDLFAGLGSLGIFRAVDFLYPSSSLYKKYVFCGSLYTTNGKGGYDEIFCMFWETYFTFHCRKENMGIHF